MDMLEAFLCSIGGTSADSNGACGLFLGRQAGQGRAGQGAVASPYNNWKTCCYFYRFQLFQEK